MASPGGPGFGPGVPYAPPAAAAAAYPGSGWPSTHGAFPPPPGQQPAHLPPYGYGSPPQPFSSPGGYGGFHRPPPGHPHAAGMRQPPPPPHASPYAPPYAPGYNRPYPPPFVQPPVPAGASPPAGTYVPRPLPAAGQEYAAAPGGYAPGAGSLANGGWPVPGPPPPQASPHMVPSPALGPLAQPRT
ncbi:hypothetical protein BU14_0111s0005, partial [Porphyra umbilicalis]